MSTIWHREFENAVVYVRRSPEDEWIVGTINAEHFRQGKLSLDEMACASQEEAVELAADQCAREAFGRLEEAYLDQLRAELSQQLSAISGQPT